MLDKAKHSKDFAVALHTGDCDFDFATNRYYYSLYQIADQYAITCLNRNIGAELDALRGRARAGHNVRVKTFHNVMLDVVRDFVPNGKMALYNNYKSLKGLRRKADYYPAPVRKIELDSTKSKALELFGLFERAIERGRK